MKSEGGSLTPLGCGTDFAAAGDKGKSRVESLEEANVTFVGRNDYCSFHNNKFCFRETRELL